MFCIIKLNVAFIVTLCEFRITILMSDVMLNVPFIVMLCDITTMILDAECHLLHAEWTYT
jgi:hypothetical protein